MGDTSCGRGDVPRRDRLLMNQGRRRIARTNRTFNGGRQARRGPIAGENEVVEAGLRARAFRRLLGVAANVARRSLTICQGGRFRGSPVKVTISAQIRSANVSRGSSSRRSTPLLVTDSRSG